MGTINYDSSGFKLQPIADAKVGDSRFLPPWTIAGAIQVDDATNPNLLYMMGQDLVNYSVVGGALQYKGVPVTIAADSQAMTDRKALLSSAAAAVAANNTYIGLASPTNAQVTAQVKALTQQMNAVLKRLVQFTT